MVDIKHILKAHAYQNIPLDFDEAYGLGAYVLKGCSGNKLAQIQSLACLCALHNKATYAWKKNDKETRLHKHHLPEDASEQIAGICAAVFDKDIAVSESGFVNPDVPYAMDNCGMGGDLIVTANVSTLAAFIAAADGIPMCKHGSPANADEGRYGSSDFVSLICGIDTYAGKEKVERCVEQFNFGYTEALDTRYKKIHTQTHLVAMLPHMNDIIGPITNPLNPERLTKKVVGINHLIHPGIVAKAYLILNQKGITHLKHGLFIRGFADDSRYEGMDEVSLCRGGTQVAELKGGIIEEYDLYASDFGTEEITRKSVSPIGDKGWFSLKILRGEIKNGVIDMVLANAAILFYLAGRSEDLKECYGMAKEVFQSGRPYEVMCSVRKMLPNHKISRMK